ncbi:putative hydrogenase 2 b cytochrome subunit [Slackia heliotrinireducens]|uniref:Polysulphide reductase n=1 Tax=Slackia heliotrinireducens (strain ATCC 29202 / DSM 20476 / NCTC 11029 / RHS 1) TaxID=471855 RepID=C7N434_SLAHD|nr:NrfD/PsrC family molybdoenzyme membrane anchor subunit [Slackia heliotrinireducens]ACV23770.1 polysulphide reductase [Slackia heliotrinireducens DSM 20476]VEH03409.1 putative hydrogenase 2 b cytochrome subunit [Slackia heliotrinireducens]
MAKLMKNPLVIGLAAIVLIGFGMYVYQLANGLGVTGMNNSTSWGAYLTCFMFFVGLSAGGLIVASSASIFHVEKYKAVALPAVICSLVCICAAGLCVLIDLGGIQRIWRMFTGMNFLSPLAWDVCVITIYIIINLFYLYFMCSKKADPAKVSIVSRFALPVAILVHSVTAWVFGMEIAREAWHTAILAPIFVASALDSGLALLLLALFALRVRGIFHTADELITSLAGLLCACVSVDFYFIFCEILTTAYNGTEGGMAVINTLLFGGTAPFFWFEIVCGLGVPFIILVFAKNRRNMKLVGIASALIVAGVFCKRCWLMFTGFATPNIVGANGITLGTTAAQTGGAANMWSVLGTYMPTLPEVCISVSVFALAGLAFIVLCHALIKPQA